MGLSQLVCGIGRKATIGLAMLGGFFLGAGESAGEEIKSKPRITLESVLNKAPERRLIVDFVNPLDDVESNSNAWYSANQLVAKGHECIGDIGLDNGQVGRYMLTLSSLYFSFGLSYYSHEMAHEYEDRKYGERHVLEFDFKDWWNNIYPRYIQHPLRNSISIRSEDSLFKGIVDGLNQDEYNARTCWNQSLINDSCDFYNSSSFLLTKLEDIRYILSVGFKDERPEAGLTKSELYDFYFKNWHLINDIDQYTGILHSRGINLTKEAYLLQSLIADCLSWHTWDSLISLGKYVQEGKLHKPSRLCINKVEVYPPLISAYLTPKGTFYNATFFARYTPTHLIEASIGHDVDFIGGGKLNSLRVGGGYCHSAAKKTRIKPFVYLNFDRKLLKYSGIAAGLEWSIQTPFGAILRGKMEYNDNDLMENRIKGEKEKLSFTAGIEIRL